MMLKNRCGWCTSDPLYINYQYSVFGVPVKDDKLLFEMLVLESFQAGLSWITILNKRDNFRKAFDSFDYKKIAKYDKSKVESLMQDKGIVRNRKKIEATINNAKDLLQIKKSNGCFSHFIWSFVNHEQIGRAHI